MQRKWVVHCPDRPRWSPCYLTVAALLIQLARGANAAPVIQVGTVEAQPGWVVELPVTFLANGSAVAAVSHNIFFDSRYTPIAQSSAGEPECWVNPAIGKEGRFAFWPGGCWQWPETCDMVAAVILSFENTQPIPDGPLFTCRVKVSPHAPAGLHAVASDYADAASPDGFELVPEHFGGGVRVVNPAGGGGGGCAIVPGGWARWPLCALLPWLAWRAGLTTRRKWPLGGAAAFVALAVSPSSMHPQVPAGTGSRAQVLAIAGSVRRADSSESGLFRGEVAVFAKGGVSGSIQIELKDRMETVNLSVRLRRGALREGRLRAPQGTLKGVFAGKVVANGSALQARPSGSLRWRDGSRYIWQLEQLRVLAKQAPGEVLDALQRGEQPTVFLHLDTTLVDGKLRLRFRDKTSPAWIRS